MIAPRWRKVLRDLVGNKIRTVLVVATISVGVFAVGFVTNLIILTTTDMQADYSSANPSVATIYPDPFDADLLHSLQNLPGLAQVEGLSQGGGKLLLPDGREFQINVRAIPGIDQIKINQIRAIDPPNANLPGKHEIFVEQSALSTLPIKIGDTVKVQLSDGTVRLVRITASIHDPTGAPFRFGQQVSAYATQETVEWLEGPSQFTQLIMTVKERSTDEAHVREVASGVAKKIEQSGRTVYFTFVFRPGRHYAYDITQSLGLIMGFFGMLSVLLSAFLVINTINALLGQHIRQIGVMKAIGARTRQLMLMYMATVLCFGLISLAISVPLAGYAAQFIAAGMAAFLNYTPGPFRIPTATIILQTFVAILIPLGAALSPVIKGTRITIREAIGSYGLGKGTFGQSMVDRLVERIRGLPRPMLISIRNTFRRKARLLLTLSALILAGSIFIAVFNLKASLDAAIAETLGYFLSDVNVNFNQWYRMQKIEPIARAVPGVVKAEGWGITNAEVLAADQTTSTQVTIFAPPANSTLVKPTMTSGRWLLPEDQNAVVIGNQMVAARPELKVGDVITISIDGKKRDWHIVGIYRAAGNVIPPVLYANYDYLGIVIGRVNQVFSLRVVTTLHDEASQQRVADQLVAAYKAAGVQVGSTSIGAFAIAQNKQSTDILVYFLLVMAGLIAAVGGLGLTSTMSMNVIERTREIGVMRAIGASNRSVQSIVIVEGMMIGIISWILGALLAIPIGMAIANAVGRLFLQSPMAFIFSMDGFIVWLVVVLILSALASFLPARSASRLTVREVLAYE